MTSNIAPDAQRAASSGARQSIMAVIAGFGLLALGACSTGALTDSYSNVYIPPGEEFVLGGGQPGVLQVSAENQVGAPVPIQALTLDGKRNQVALAARGEVVRYSFVNGDAAVLVNPSATERAHVRVSFNGSPNDFGMRYAPASPTER